MSDEYLKCERKLFGKNSSYKIHILIKVEENGNIGIQSGRFFLYWKFR